MSRRSPMLSHSNSPLMPSTSLRTMLIQAGGWLAAGRSCREPAVTAEHPGFVLGAETGTFISHHAFGKMVLRRTDTNTCLPTGENLSALEMRLSRI